MDKTFVKEILKEVKSKNKNPNNLAKEVGIKILLNKNHPSLKWVIDFSKKRMASDEEYYEELYHQLIEFLEND
jgi:hypothetical protein